MNLKKKTFFRSHNLLADEIATAIHNLASVNITWFFNNFLMTFLANCECLDDTQRSTLLNNFDKSTVSINYSIYLSIILYLNNFLIFFFLFIRINQH